MDARLFYPLACLGTRYHKDNNPKQYLMNNVWLPWNALKISTPL